MVPVPVPELEPEPEVAPEVAAPVFGADSADFCVFPPKQPQPKCRYQLLVYSQHPVSRRVSPDSSSRRPCEVACSEVS